MRKMSILIVIMLILTGCSSDNLEAKNKIISKLQDEVEMLKIDIQINNKTLSDLKEKNSKIKSDLVILEQTLVEANDLIESFEVEPIDEPMEVMISDDLLATAFEVITFIELQDFVSVSTYVDPTLGLRFSPYSYINFMTDLWFSPSQVANLMFDPLVYTWGNYDGSGDPITSNFIGYYNEFVYDETYASPHLIGNNTLVGTGNMINNLNTTYPTASYVEFHFTGFNPIYEGLDWSSLRLIFENVSGVWKLIGIEHDNWTI